MKSNLKPVFSTFIDLCTFILLVIKKQYTNFTYKYIGYWIVELDTKPFGNIITNIFFSHKFENAIMFL